MARILLVDDAPEIRRYVSVALKKQGHVMYSVGTGTEAITALSTTSFDIVLLDLHLPDITGCAVLSVLCAQHPRIAVIVITAFPSTDTMREAIRCGARDYLVKPFRNPQLLETIGRVTRSPPTDISAIQPPDSQNSYHAPIHLADGPGLFLPGPARPPITQSLPLKAAPLKRIHQIHFRGTEAEHAFLLTLATESDLSLNSTIRRLVRVAMRRHAAGQPS